MTIFGIWRAGQGQSLCALNTLQIQSRFEHLSAEQIRAAIKTELSAGFFGLDLAAVRMQLKALPWVEQVEVRKHWPATVMIRLTERTAIARWGKEGLLDANGEVFYVKSAGAMHGLVHLIGPNSRRQELVQFYRSSEPVLRNLSLHLTKARYSKRGALTLQLSDASKIILGREQQMPRWQRFVDNLPTLRAKNQGLRLLEIDLRYTNGLAARFAPPSDSEASGAPAPKPAPSTQPAARTPNGPALLANFGAGLTSTHSGLTSTQTQANGAAR